MSILKPFTFNAPACWASYYINNDASGLESSEKLAADAFLAAENLHSPVCCGDESFIGRFNGLQTDLLQYTCLI